MWNESAELHVLFKLILWFFILEFAARFFPFHFIFFSFAFHFFLFVFLWAAAEIVVAYFVYTKSEQTPISHLNDRFYVPA